jgi:hypothetical protein
VVPSQQVPHISTNETTLEALISRTTDAWHKKSIVFVMES